MVKHKRKEVPRISGNETPDSGKNAPHETKQNPLFSTVRPPFIHILTIVIHICIHTGSIRYKRRRRYAPMNCGRCPHDGEENGSNSIHDAIGVNSWSEARIHGVSQFMTPRRQFIKRSFNSLVIENRICGFHK